MIAPVPASQAIQPAAVLAPAAGAVGSGLLNASPDRGALEAWRTDRDVLLLASFVLLLAGLLVVTPDGQGVSLLGWQLPDVCLSRRMGTPCMGCGLTRSFVLGVRGDLLGAWAMHPIGPGLLLLFAAQLPLRASRLLRARAFKRRGLRDPRLASRPRRGALAFRASLAALALLWIVSKAFVPGAQP